MSTKEMNASQTIFPVIFALCFVHLMNDTVQSVIPAIFPILKDSLALTFTQVGLIAFTLNATASVLQPLIGLYTDKRPLPYILPVGVMFTLAGVITLAYAPDYTMVLLAVVLVGIGSAIFHPESARVAYIAAGARKGMGQSIFQFGGNIGQALAPVMTALVFVRLGQGGAIWFSFAAGAAIVVQFFVANWYRRHLAVANTQKQTQPKIQRSSALSGKKIAFALTILMLLLFSKNIYIAGISNYYSFYLIDHFHLTLGQAQMVLLAFLAANVLGLIIGGSLTDRFGRRNIIWFSVLGTAPFSIALPYAGLVGSIILLILIGLILSSTFSVIVVYAHELLPGKVGMVSGIFFGLSFGLGGIGAAVLGGIADSTSLEFILKITSFLPLLGILTALLPKDSALQISSKKEA